MTTLYLNDILLPLSNLLGEESIPNPIPTSRVNAIQGGLRRIARLYDFDWTKQPFTVAIVAGIGTLDPTVRVDANFSVKVDISGYDNDLFLDPIDLDQIYDTPEGELKYAIRQNTDGSRSVITSERSQSTLSILANVDFPTISASVGILFPDPLIVARFALIIVREGEDKDADTSVEEAKAQAALQELIQAEVRNRGPRRAIGIQEKVGDYTGNVSNDPYSIQWYS